MLAVLSVFIFQTFTSFIQLKEAEKEWETEIQNSCF